MKLSVFWKRLFTPQNCCFFGGGDFTPKMGSNINGTPKGHTLARDRVVWAIKRENLSTSLICRRVPEKGVKIVIFHPFAQKPPWADLHQIWHSRRGRRLNDLYQFFGDRLRGVDSVGGGAKIAITHWQGQSPLTQGWRYRAARDAMYSDTFTFQQDSALTHRAPETVELTLSHATPDFISPDDPHY